MRSKKSWMIASCTVVIVLFLVLAVILSLPPKTTVTVIDVNEVNETPYAEKYQELQKQQNGNDWSLFGDLWMIVQDSILGQKQTTFIVPCVSFKPCDVGTAGKSEWISYFKLLSDNPIDVNDVTARFISDSNTLLYSPNSLADLDLPEIGQDGQRYFARISTSTIDSEIKPNENCFACVSWTALISLPHGRTFCQVKIDSEAPYYNNV